MIEEIPLFGLGFQGKSPNVTANKLINAYYQFEKQQDRTKVSIYGTPGLTLFADKGDTPWRGLRPFPKNSLLYGVHRNTFYDINNAGVITARGTIGTSSGRVDISDNGTEISVVDGAEIYVYNTSTPATPIAAVADVDRPISPNTCTFQGGRILTDENGTGQFKGSDLYAATIWQGLNFATAESHPDNVIRIINVAGTIVLFGEFLTEFWSNIGGSGFPYAKIPGTDIEYGLAARWSVAKFIGTYAFLAKNREGQVIVAMLRGYGFQKISNEELDHVINKYPSHADATGYGYMLGGHPMYQLNFPGQGTSFLYDGSTQYWSELKSGTGRHRGEIAEEFLGKIIIADYENGKLYRQDIDNFTDNDAPIITTLRGRHIFESKKMVRLGRIELGIEAGVGTATGQGVDPQAMLKLSKDGGHTFGTERFAPMGKVGEYKRRCMWRRNGRGRDIVPEVSISDPVKRVITEATLYAGVGR